MAVKAHDLYTLKENPFFTSTNVGETIHLIGFASGIGAPDPDCGHGPLLLRQMELEKILSNHGLQAKWKTFLTTPVLNLKHKQRIDFLLLQLKSLANVVAKSVFQRERFVVIGGDHSCAIGTWSGASHQLQSSGRLGLIWVDAHMDSHTPLTSYSGELHGMPLACLLGYGEQRFTQLFVNIPKILPQHLCLLGVRSYETEEAQLLKHLGVRVIDMKEIKQRGLSNAMQEALEIATRGTIGFGVSLDLDSLDPSEAPGVSTPEMDGISGKDLLAALEILSDEKKLIGLEIAELNPFKDRNLMTANLAIKAILASLAVHK